MRNSNVRIGGIPSVSCGLKTPLLCRPLRPRPLSREGVILHLMRFFSREKDEREWYHGRLAVPVSFEMQGRSYFVLFTALAV